MDQAASLDGRSAGRLDALAYAAIVALGVLAWWGATFRAAAMPVWGPFDFQPLWYLSATLFGFWYARGLLSSDAEERPAIWRQVVFVLGVAVTYAVLQTRFEYWAEHMFFLNRLQHVIMHHLGPLLIALSWPVPMLKRGMPPVLLVPGRWRWLKVVMAVVQQPFVAALLFVGLIALWLYPPVHFRAMLDSRLYLLMNVSMVGDGLLFWMMVLDPRDRPEAHASFVGRSMTALLVMFPQIAIGAVIAFSHSDLYGFYAWCGRIIPSIGPLDDQQYGGLIIWIPAAMMSVVGMILVLDNMRRHQEQNAPETDGSSDDESGMSAASWTGR